VRDCLAAAGGGKELANADCIEVLRPSAARFTSASRTGKEVIAAVLRQSPAGDEIDQRHPIPLCGNSAVERNPAACKENHTQPVFEC
jgi:hypothetical protein